MKPKKKDTSTEEDGPVDVIGVASHKKHKKHKHKKHKKRKDGDEDCSSGGSPSNPNENVKPGLKLKIKIGGQTFGEARVSKTEIDDFPDDEIIDIGKYVAMKPKDNCHPGKHVKLQVSGDTQNNTMPIASASNNGNQCTKGGKKVDEEEAWLAALEAGRLEEVDEELRRMKDPNLMTARQRALLESKAQKEREEPIPVVIEEKELTEEMIQRRMIRAKKRKQQAEEKREKDKKQTIERLLKKTDSKIKGLKKMTKKMEVPKVTYVNSLISGLSVSFPPGLDFPLQPQVAKEPPKAVHCGVEGCKNFKRYSCSKTGVSLCSLECYKKNLTSGKSKVHIQATCYLQNLDIL